MSSILTLNFKDEIISLENTSLINNPEDITELILSENVKYIDSNTFSKFINIKKLTMPVDLVLAHDGTAFSHCKNIEEIVLIGTNGTNYSNNLNSKELTYYKYTPWYISKDSLKSITISESIRSFGTNFFRGLDKTHNVYIPWTIWNINIDSFSMYLDSIKNRQGYLSKLYENEENIKDKSFRYTDINLNFEEISEDKKILQQFYFYKDKDDNYWFHYPEELEVVWDNENKKIQINNNNFESYLKNTNIIIVYDHKEVNYDRN